MVYVMSKEQIQQYLDKAKYKNRDKLKTYLSKNGTLNDVDYYIEVMKRYYPNGDEPTSIEQHNQNNDGRLVIKFRR